MSVEAFDIILRIEELNLHADLKSEPSGMSRIASESFMFRELAHVISREERMQRTAKAASN